MSRPATAHAGHRFDVRSADGTPLGDASRIVLPREKMRVGEAPLGLGKAQLSAALNVPGDAHEELRAFADPIYLHQVTERGSLRTWPDLPEALAANGNEEWRVHFHVPIFVERYGALESHVRRLDLRAGTLERDVRWCSPAAPRTCSRSWPFRTVPGGRPRTPARPG